MSTPAATLPSDFASDLAPIFHSPGGQRKRPIGSRISSLKVNGRFIADDFRYMCIEWGAVG